MIVKVLSEDGSIVAKYGSISEASRDLGISKGCISECLSGKRKSAGGYYFRVLKDSKVS